MASLCGLAATLQGRSLFSGVILRYPATFFRCCFVALVAAALSSCASFQKPESADVVKQVEMPSGAIQPVLPADDAVASLSPPVLSSEPMGPPVFTPEQQAELEQLPSPETDLWEVIVSGYNVPDLQGSLVTKWEQWYSSRPDYIARIVNRSRLYLYHIVHEVQARQMPMEIALLPMIESAYNPNALSRSRASGIWQFIPSTGKNYGLKQDWWVDERRDVLSATDSALDYLQKLYRDFNDWQLALAAYNCGEGCISRALAKNRAQGLPETYEALKIPNETVNYVPKLQAVKNIIRDPEKYNIELADMPDAPYFTVVKTTRRMDIDMAVSLAEMSKEEFLALNPQHNRPVIAGADEFTLLLPFDKAELFASKLELADQPLVTWQAHRLQKGETFAQVANKFGMSLEALQAINGLGRRAQAREGMMLLVPAQQPSQTTEASLAKAVFTTVPSGRMSHYKVKRGDTLTQIASRYGTTVNELMRLNGLKNAKTLRVGKNLRVYEGEIVRTASSARTPDMADARVATTAQATYYKVQKGDTLGHIASRYRVSVQDLMRWNNLANAQALRAGQDLRVSHAPTRVVAQQPTTKNAKANDGEGYKVQKGDTLFAIASRYSVSVDDLMRWNNLKKATALRAGQTIRVSGNSDTKVARFGKN
ncbi:MAG: LysM peptidoglycan-binding domain-containing protein [Burkholderiales bacterium]|jgi:membrane-bound lytic murein transglycosylase D|nr:LysM peptidoglycan-binding domain-containing protein [Burkholderiales bacterium]